MARLQDQLLSVLAGWKQHPERESKYPGDSNSQGRAALLLCSDRFPPCRDGHAALQESPRGVLGLRRDRQRVSFISCQQASKSDYVGRGGKKRLHRVCVCFKKEKKKSGGTKDKAYYGQAAALEINFCLLATLLSAPQPAHEATAEASRSRAVTRGGQRPPGGRYRPRRSGKRGSGSGPESTRAAPRPEGAPAAEPPLRPSRPGSRPPGAEERPEGSAGCPRGSGSRLRGRQKAPRRPPARPRCPEAGRSPDSGRLPLGAVPPRGLRR